MISPNYGTPWRGPIIGTETWRVSKRLRLFETRNVAFKMALQGPSWMLLRNDYQGPWRPLIIVPEYSNEVRIFGSNFQRPWRPLEIRSSLALFLEGLQGPPEIRLTIPKSQRDLGMKCTRKVNEKLNTLLVFWKTPKECLVWSENVRSFASGDWGAKPLTNPSVVKKIRDLWTKDAQSNGR